MFNQGHYAFEVIFAVSMIWYFLGHRLDPNRTKRWRMNVRDIYHEAKVRGTLATPTETSVSRILERGSMLLAIVSIVSCFLGYA